MLTTIIKLSAVAWPNCGGKVSRPNVYNIMTVTVLSDPWTTSPMNVLERGQAELLIKHIGRERMAVKKERGEVQFRELDFLN